MPFSAVLSTNPTTADAVTDCLAKASWSGPAHLALAFFSPHHRQFAVDIAQAVSAALKPSCFLGCQGETVVGNDREMETGPALALWLGRWSDEVELSPFHLTMEETSEGFSLLGWPDDLAGATPADGLLLTLADPFSFPVDDFLNQVNEEQPGLRVVGGMASGGRQPGEAPLLIGADVRSEGAVGVFMQGPVKARSVVSQGCRPIGKPLVITKAQDNVIIELGGKSALLQLQEVWQTLNERDRQLVQSGGLHVGRVLSEYRETFGRGDFLIRNVLGIDKNTGALAITERVRVGQTVQYHVRDAATADEDLHLLLQQDRAAGGTKAGAALLFSCNGRGTRLFGQPDHDAGAVRAELGEIPLAGFFAQGELGPIGGRNFIHGYTASVLVFDE